MNTPYYQMYLETLQKELIPALGCTEPIAIAYAGAKAREVLGLFPERIEIACSGNIIKNVKGVTVPNSGGLHGIDVAAVLGVVGGNAAGELEVLQHITPEHIEKTKQMIAEGRFSCKLEKNVANLYISAAVYAEGHSATVTIVNRHTLITHITRDGEVLYHVEPTVTNDTTIDWDSWSVRSILDFATTVNVEDIREVLDSQITKNTTIAEAGLTQHFGAEIGKTLLETYGDSVQIRAKARAAAGSDARMGGCSLPVVINSGSGNQGMTVSLPVIEYAHELGSSQEQLYRALVISNLISIYQKHYIGSLSAFCGAVTAACGSGAAITWLCGGDYDAICRTIINTIVNVAGIVCDGAKSSCAAKIASSVDAAILAHQLSMKGIVFQVDEGLVQDSVDETIKCVGYIGRVGMEQTDSEILDVIMHQVDYN